VAVEANRRLASELDDLAALVASCPAAQSKFGAPGNPLLTAERIYYTANVVTGPDTGGVGGNVSIDAAGLQRPYAIVLRPPGLLYRREAAGEQNWLTRQGTLWLYLTANSTQPQNAKDDARDFANFAGGVEEWIAQHAGRDDWLPVAQMGFVFGPRKSGADRQATQGQWWECLYWLTYE